MSDNFNPYAQWLGLPTTATSPDHYQLLGIHESVTDPAAIASAADRAMTRVRACKPGPHAAAWAQLLDRISAAKTTLTDSEQRQKYEQQLATQSVPVGAPVNPNLLPPTHNAAHPPTVQPTVATHPISQAFDPMAPVMMSPLPVAPQVRHPTPVTAIPMAVPYLQPAAPTFAAPNPMAPVAPAAPIAHAIPFAPVPMAPVQAVPFGAYPDAAVASPMFAAQPIAVGEQQPFDDAPKLKGKRSVTARAHAKSGGMLGPVLLGGSIGGLILVFAGVAIFLSGSQSNPSSPSVAAVTTSPLPVGTGESTSTFPRRLDEMPESERPKPTVFRPTTQPDASPTPSMEPAPPVTSAPVTPAPVTPTPPPPTPTPTPPPAPGPSRAELRALAQALTTVRDAIGEQNFPVADREIAKASALAKSDEHKAKVVRLQLLRDYVGRYRAAISETLGRFRGGDQIDLGDGKTFGIVEVTPDLLVIRVSGQNRRYPMNELPLGLASLLAEMSLDKASLDTTAMKAAFVSINPKLGDADRVKATAWWKEAASVRDVPDLIAAINDDYTLKQDVVAVPLEPNAMAELTARGDRLKGARTIEDFAKEFQAAIDESVKTLAPEMELTIGGSTIVTVKELKSDRVMLSVAGESRGFPFTKLPLGLAASIAERILPRDAALTMVMKGAYYAAREKDQSSKQFRAIVLAWWKQAGEMDQQLQPVIQELVKQYPE
ncbi:MAG: hypothetical protein ABI614_10385 [Planctomycetota bacterium]